MLGSVADILTDAGHNVTVLVSIIDESERGKYGVKKTKQLLFVEPDESAESFVKHMKEFQKDMWKDDVMSPRTLLTGAQQFADVLSGQCNKVLGSTELLEQIKAENYDLAIGEPFDLCPYAFFEAVNIRAHVAVLSSNRFEHASAVLGQPMASSYVPGAQSTFTEVMNIKERLINTIGSFATSYMFTYAGDYQFKKAREVVDINRSWREVLPEASFVFTNEIPILGFTAPTFDKIVPIGGISVNTKKADLKVPEKWSKILDVKKQNVLISFGSIAKSINMPDEVKRVRRYFVLAKYTINNRVQNKIIG